MYTEGICLLFEQFYMPTYQEYQHFYQVKEVKSRQDKHIRCYQIASGLHLNRCAAFSSGLISHLIILFDCSVQIWNAKFSMSGQNACGVLWREVWLAEVSLVCH